MEEEEEQAVKIALKRNTRASVGLLQAEEGTQEQSCVEAFPGMIAESRRVSEMRIRLSDFQALVFVLIGF